MENEESETNELELPPGAREYKMGSYIHCHDPEHPEPGKVKIYYSGEQGRRDAIGEAWDFFCLITDITREEWTRLQFCSDRRDHLEGAYERSVEDIREMDDTITGMRKVTMVDRRVEGALRDKLREVEGERDAAMTEASEAVLKQLDAEAALAKALVCPHWTKRRKRLDGHLLDTCTRCEGEWPAEVRGDTPEAVIQRGIRDGHIDEEKLEEAKGSLKVEVKL